MNLIPFDLQKAIAGEELITRDGSKVKGFHYFEDAVTEGFPIRAVIDGQIQGFTKAGNWTSYPFNHEYDLFMKPKTKELFKNVYRNGVISSCWYEREDADILNEEVGDSRIAMLKGIFDGKKLLTIETIPE